jgi:hypothetical protein
MKNMSDMKSIGALHFLAAFRKSLSPYFSRKPSGSTNQLFKKIVNFIFGMLTDILYMRYGSGDLPQSLLNFISIEFLLIPPLINPLIYGFKLTKIRNRIITIFQYQVKTFKKSEPPCDSKSTVMEATLPAI